MIGRQMGPPERRHRHHRTFGPAPMGAPLGAHHHHGRGGIFGHGRGGVFGRRMFLWGPGGFPGPLFGGGPRVGRGDVRAAILVLLAEGPMHGYQVIQELTERSGGLWRPSPGSVYPTLQLLEDEGLVRSEEVDGRRVFHLTDAGKAQAAKRGKEAPAPWEVSAEAGPLLDLREVGFGVVAAVMQVAHAGTERQMARAKEILAEARRELYRLLGEDDPAREDVE